MLDIQNYVVSFSLSLSLFFFLNNYVVSNSSNADGRIHISNDKLFNVNTNQYLGYVWIGRLRLRFPPFFFHPFLSFLSAVVTIHVQFNEQ